MGKRQHYVPRIYLRKFSENNATIRVYSIKANRFVAEEASISRQCYANYYYGKDPNIEENLSEVEGAFKKVSDKIIAEHAIPDKKSPDYQVILLYIIFQQSRTPSAVAESTELLNKLMKQILKNYIKLSPQEGITSGKVDSVNLEFTEPAAFTISTAIKAFPLLFDLACKLLINQTEIDFISTDNPVIIYNKYYQNSFQDHLGFACKGLIIIFPLDSKHCIILFDSIMYKIGGKKLHSNVDICNSHDIDQLNILQMINATDIAYAPKMSETYIKTLMSIASPYRNIETTSIKNIAIKKHGKQTGAIIQHSKKGIKYNLELTFLRINLKIPNDYLTQPIARDPVLCSVYEQFCKEVDEKKYNLSDFGLYLIKKGYAV